MNLQKPNTQKSDSPKLLMRADDMGGSHAANIACIQTYEKGIVQSVEVMVPGPWFEEAAILLRDIPGVDVGIHLVLTSEWKTIRWRPLTYSPGITDEDGYFCQFIWASNPESNALRLRNWKIEEIENEFRAQIELGKKKLPQATHLTTHMACEQMADSVKSLYWKLGKEYGLTVAPEDGSKILHGVPKFTTGTTLDEWVDGFTSMLKQLKPGTRYLYLEHPAFDDSEIKAFDLTGAVAAQRSNITKAFTHPKTIEAIEANQIQLISYADLAS